MTTSDEPVPKRRRVSAAAGSAKQAGAASNMATSEPLKEEAKIQSQTEGFPETRGGSPSEAKGEGSADSAAVGVSEDPLIPERVGAFMQRELFFLQQEENGNFSFQYMQNDGQPSHNLWLVALKNIFSRQLPNMPKEYITRLVLDHRHRSVAVVRRDGSVVGGITYRPFHSQGFGEIAFCAVSSSDQVKGFGSRLMSYTKEYAKERDNLSHFLTYADNNAVTFFGKQGFTTDVTLERERWLGYIKDYDGGTLMESILHSELPYTRIPHMLKEQRAALGTRIRGLSTAHVIYPGLTHFSDPDAQPLEPQQIPGVEEAGWTPAEPPKLKLLLDGQELPVTAESIHRLGQILVAALKAHEDSAAFVVPVRAEEVPDYYDIVKDPMDLSKIKRRLESGKFYVSLDLLKADIRRIWKNAHLYNAVDTYWHKAASRLERFADQFLTSRLVHVK